MVVGHKEIFLDTADKHIAIVEGIFDALSVLKVGGLAVAPSGKLMMQKKHYTGASNRHFRVMPAGLKLFLLFRKSMIFFK